jgi:hypothetical protein
MAQLRVLVCVLLGGALSAGCLSSRLIAPHQPYAPLLDHEGQLDIVVRAGPMEGPDTSAAAQVAFSPAEGFEIAASVDGDWSTAGNATQHIGGGLALGAYSRTDVFRAEVLVGANGGTADGAGQGCTLMPMGICGPSASFGISANYVQPFVQGLLGFEVPYFELAGGMRLFGYLADVAFAGSDGSHGTTAYEKLYLEQILTIRVPIDIVRFEVLGGVPLSLLGDPGPIPGSTEVGFHPYVLAGLGFQFDTMGSPMN